MAFGNTFFFDRVTNEKFKKSKSRKKPGERYKEKTVVVLGTSDKI